jgi:hypothetical protein
VIVGESGDDVASEAFRHAGGTMTGLGDLPGGAFASAALAASGDGSVVVGRGSGPGGDAAFVWDPAHGMRELAAVLGAGGVDLTGWELLEATGVSDAGTTVVGNGRYLGAPRGWLATLDAGPGPAPVPALSVPGLVGLVALLGAVALRSAGRGRRARDQDASGRRLARSLGSSPVAASIRRERGARADPGRGRGCEARIRAGRRPRGPRWPRRGPGRRGRRSRRW